METGNWKLETGNWNPYKLGVAKKVKK